MRWDILLSFYSDLQVAVTCPRSACWYVACLMLHSLVSKCAWSTSCVFAEQGLPLEVSYGKQIWFLLRPNTSMNISSCLRWAKINMDHCLHRACFQLVGTECRDKQHILGFPGDSDCKASACSAGDLGSIPGSGRSPGEGNGNPLQYSCLENSMSRGAW